MGRMLATFGDGAIGLLRSFWPRSPWRRVSRAPRLGRGRRDGSHRRLAWFGAIVLGFAAVRVPLQLDKEWITVGWALEGLTVTASGSGSIIPGSSTSAPPFAAVTSRLLLNPEVLTITRRRVRSSTGSPTRISCRPRACSACAGSSREWSRQRRVVDAVVPVLIVGRDG